ncbi:hypothetical protein [Pelagibius sp.]|uniref:hypothetical protein n=1 Tax=Pelagibius sp. TaxID=1931238 RepID=UPI002624223E|nr:hypothetical protein [Pelagibius sp.]
MSRAARDGARERQQAAHAKRGHASNPPRAAASPPPEPKAERCGICGGRGTYGYFGKPYCGDHLPDDFWNVKRRAEGEPVPERTVSPPRRQGPDQGCLF